MPVMKKKNNLIDVKIYYREVFSKEFNTTRYNIIEDSVAEEELKNFEEKKKADPNLKSDIQIINVKFRNFTWKDELDVNEKSLTYNDISGNKEINYIKFKDTMLKRGLAFWDITDEEGNKVPVSSQAIDDLPSEIAYELLKKYEKYVYLKDDIKKN
jgi:hypothetical protein